MDRATLAVNEVFGEGNDRLNAARLLRRARAAVICPRVFKAAFFFGGEGGDCVLVGRDAAGSWSSPAFYCIRSGSFGLQAGIQDLQIVMLVMNDRALTAVLDDQLKFGADASLAVATLGGSVEASTTAAVGADILAFARARGLYAGLTLEGSLLAAKQRVEPLLLPAGRVAAADRGGHAGAQPGRRPAARGADALRQRRRRRGRGAAAAAAGGHRRRTAAAAACRRWRAARSAAGRCAADRWNARRCRRCVMKRAGGRGDWDDADRASRPRRPPPLWRRRRAWSPPGRRRAGAERRRPSRPARSASSCPSRRAAPRTCWPASSRSA